jgi:hypothetical protein
MNVRLRIHYFEEAHDVWVVHACQDVDLTVDCHQLGLSGEKALLVALQRHYVACVLMSALFDRGVGSVADVLVGYEILGGVEYRILSLSFQVFDQLDELLPRCCLAGDLGLVQDSGINRSDLDGRSSLDLGW